MDEQLRRALVSGVRAFLAELEEVAPAADAPSGAPVAASPAPGAHHPRRKSPRAPYVQQGPVDPVTEARVARIAQQKGLLNLATVGGSRR